MRRAWSVCGVCGVVGLGLVACGRHEAKAPAPEPSQSNAAPQGPKADPVELAKARAQATWERFAVALSEADPGRRGFAIKKGFPYKTDHDSGLDYVWIGDVSWDGDLFHGNINNSATRAGVEAGDRVEIRPEEIADWMYLDGKVLRGGYTVRALYWSDPDGDVRKAMDAQGITVPHLEDD